MRPLYKGIAIAVFAFTSLVCAQENSGAQGAAEDTTKPEYWLSLSVQIEDTDVKIEYLTRAIELDSENEDALYRRGVAYDDSGMYKEAVKDFTSALKNAGKDPYVYNARAISYKNMEDYESALKDLNNALELADKNKLKAALRLNRGQVYKAMGEKEKALSDFKKVRKLVMGGPIFMNAISEINALKD